MLLIIVHRLLQSFLFPPLNAMLIMLVGIIMLLFKKKSSLLIISIGWIFLYVQSIPLTAYIISKNYELSPIQTEDFKLSQAIVILGGGINNSSLEYPSGINVNDGTAVRLNYAAYLAKQDPKKLIITSGGYTGSIREANVMRDKLITAYDVKNPIILENQSRNTDENAKFVADILLPMHIKNVVLVTQAFHMRRSMMLFKKYGLNPIAASTDYYSSYDALTPALTLIPNASAMRQISLVYHEILGYSVYK